MSELPYKVALGKITKSNLNFGVLFAKFRFESEKGQVGLGSAPTSEELESGANEEVSNETCHEESGS